jgi:hypothetical protein
MVPVLMSMSPWPVMAAPMVAPAPKVWRMVPSLVMRAVAPNYS